MSWVYNINSPLVVNRTESEVFEDIGNGLISEIEGLGDGLLAVHYAADDKDLTPPTFIQLREKD
jgi:hypothetical protein